PLKGESGCDNYISPDPCPAIGRHHEIRDVTRPLHFAYRQPSPAGPAMTSLAIFDIDGTLTDTNAVDGDCYRTAVAEAFGVSERELDWTRAPHFSDRGIFEWLWDLRGGRSPTNAEMARARDRVTELLSAEVISSPARFAPIAGAPQVF